MRMTPERWDQVKVLFAAAIELPAENRSSFLTDSGADEELRDEVARLLVDMERTGSILAKPAAVRLGLGESDLCGSLKEGLVLAHRFQIIQFLARGGMGEVYRAQDLQLDRTVALKFLPPELAENSEALGRFRREAKAASALNHPGICTVYDLGQDQRRVFIAMECLEGETLSTRLKRGPCTVLEALQIAIPIASALKAAHSTGIVHRDLKPDNIMLTGHGVKLLDFGVALYTRPQRAEEETTESFSHDERVAGTLPYMAPEQLRGEKTDGRSDIFAFGAILYEMLVSRRAFEGDSSVEVIAAIVGGHPAPMPGIGKKIPRELGDIVSRCLQKRRSDRYPTMQELERALLECSEAVAKSRQVLDRRLLLKTLRKPAVAVPVALLGLFVIGLLGWRLHFNSKVQWAKEKALPEIQRLSDEEQFDQAYSLASQAEKYIPEDAALVKLWNDFSFSPEIESNPQGIKVYKRPYNSAKAKWEFMGVTPIKNHRIPISDAVWKFELPGYATTEQATFAHDLGDSKLYVQLDPVGQAPPGMTRVELSQPGAESLPIGVPAISGLDGAPRVPIRSFWIDRFEVTNREFKEFVDQGGYSRPEFWKQPFLKDGKTLSWQEAMKLFRDQTGRFGPATWVASEYPKGQDDYPVTGVSWFEAAAYAEFVGKMLPTVYHWAAAAFVYDGSSIIPASNFGSRSVAPVGQYQGMSWSGAFDMAGNAKEWVFNEEYSGKRYILGASWNDPTYAFYQPDARSPFDRSSNFGFRCARYSLTGREKDTLQPLHAQVRDYSVEKPVSDQVFNAYKSLYSYDKTPLNAVVHELPTTDTWREEKITFDAAYGGEQVAAFLFLPRKARPPFQTVVYISGVGAFFEKSSADLTNYTPDFDFIVKSGRAVLFPVIKGTFERWNNFLAHPKTTSFYRDGVIDWSKDLGRSIDYLETRPDIDTGKLAYEGDSMGAALGALLPAMEPRIKALVLVSPGFWNQKRLPEADQINFVSHITAPTLMLNGSYDAIFPISISQEPMYRLLGTPFDKKRRVVYNVGHDIPRADEIKEVLAWLDKYLGKVG